MKGSPPKYMLSELAEVFISSVLFLGLWISAEICMLISFQSRIHFACNNQDIHGNLKTHWLIIERANIELLLILVTFLRPHFEAIFPLFSKVGRVIGVYGIK